MNNLRTIEVHKNAVVIDPLFTLPDAVETIVSRLISRTLRSQQHFELGDPGGISPYRDALNQIDATIGALKRARSEMQSFAQHAHQWSKDDYCLICGADGAA